MGRIDDHERHRDRVKAMCFAAEDFKRGEIGPKQLADEYDLLLQRAFFEGFRATIRDDWSRTIGAALYCLRRFFNRKLPAPGRRYK